MEYFKVENFLEEYPDRSFPVYEELSSFNCDRIRDAISLKYKIDNKDLCEFVTLIDQKQICIDSFNAMDSSFDLSCVFEKVRIKPLEMIYINWYRYDQIDKIPFRELVKYFDYIWYPSSDDIDLFDSSFDWILSIDHAGYIKLLASA